VQDSEYQIIAVLVKVERESSLGKYGFVKRKDR
jgi:hypothetical protein